MFVVSSQKLEAIIGRFEGICAKYFYFRHLGYTIIHLALLCNSNTMVQITLSQ